MWADVLHTCYTMPINIVVGGVPTVAHIRWYKAPAGAKQLPFASAFFTHVWDNNPGESVPGEIGEVGYPRVFDEGTNPGYQGQCYRGDPSWFGTGQLPALNTITPSPCLCQIPPAIAGGGLVLAGSAAAQYVASCQRGTNIVRTVLIAPSPVLGQFTNLGGDPPVYRLADPTYPFFWMASYNFATCHGVGRTTTFWASASGSPSGPHLFNPICLFDHLNTTGEWVVPGNAPYYPGQVFYLFGN